MEDKIIPFRKSERLLPYTRVIDRETLGRATAQFRTLHPELLPIVVWRVLEEFWCGELDAEQIKQALRDCYDMVESAFSGGRLYAPAAFLRSRLVLCLENQSLGLPSGEPSTPHSPQLE